MNPPSPPLCCPVTRQLLVAASPELLASLQQGQMQLGLRDVSARLVRQPFEAAWLTADGSRAYLVRGGVADLRGEAAVLLGPLQGAPAPEASSDSAQ